MIGIGFSKPSSVSSGATSMPSGAIMHRFVAGALTGWVLAHGGTIGSADSGASERANADTEALYTLLWNGVLQALCPVDGGRGANAAADFAANKPLTLPDLRGQVAVAQLDTSTRFNLDVGYAIGSEDHTLIEGELPVIAEHNHSTDFGAVSVSVTEGGPESVIKSSGGSSVANGGGFGSGNPHNNIQPSRIVGAVYLKL